MAPKEKRKGGGATAQSPQLIKKSRHQRRMAGMPDSNHEDRVCRIFIGGITGGKDRNSANRPSPCTRIVVRKGDGFEICALQALENSPPQSAGPENDDSPSVMSRFIEGPVLANAGRSRCLAEQRVELLAGRFHGETIQIFSRSHWNQL